MAEEYNNEIVCPYCKYEFTDSWEYDEHEFFVFCDTCHDSWHKAKTVLDKIVGTVVTCADVFRIAGYAKALSSEDCFYDELENDEMVLGYADLFRTNKSTIKFLIKEAKEKGWPVGPTPLLYRQIQNLG